MLELHTWRTPNGKKVPILLAELDRPYTLRLVDLTKNEQKQPEFLRINPNGKIPALVDASGEGAPVVLFESGAILQYLAEKDPERRFLPRGERERAEVLSWLFWQIGGPGPMFGQLGAFSRESPRNEPAYAKFLAEGKRLVGVLEGHLAARPWIAGDYSIADIANYPWFAGIATFLPEVLDGATRVREWMKRAEARPAVQKGMGIERAHPKGLRLKAFASERYTPGMVAPASPLKRATYDDVLGAPPHVVAEVIDGVLTTHPRPASPHAQAASTLGEELGPPFKRGKGGPGGWVLLDEPELHLGPEPDILVSDLAAWRRKTMPVMPEAAFFTVRPDWVCEVLSPSTQRHDRRSKLPVYRRENVTHVWLVDPAPRTLEVLELDGPSYRLVATYADAEQVRAPPFDAIVLDLALLWLR